MQNYWQEHKHFFKGLIATIAITVIVGIFGESTGEFMASVLDLEQPAPFDGTSLPIETVPDWTKVGGRTSLLAAQIPLEQKINLPNYDPIVFGATVADLNWSVDTKLANQLVTFAVPYMGSYESGSREYEGSHLAVDIKVPIGTPIHAVANGKVVKVAQSSSGFGKHIVIKHYDVPNLDENETIDLYSAYAHLSLTNVIVGQIVTRGELIGESGSTGTSTTPHLHFQIDKDSAPWHPWWPFSSADCATAGVNFFDGVSAGIGQAAAIENTINPMLWVQHYLVTDETKNPSDLHANENSEIENEEKNIEIETKEIAETVEPVAIEVVASTAEIIETPTGTEENDSNKEDKIVEEKVVAETEEKGPNEVNELLEEKITIETIFTDVDSTHPNATAIKYLLENEIVGGYDDGSFQPEKTVNRVEALKMLILGFGVADNPKLDLGFEDTSNQAWYSNYVGTAMNRGIVSGYADNTFRPGNTINRAEYLKILLFTAGISPDSVDENPYSDVSAEVWFSAFANYSKLKNIFPLDSNLFEGGNGVTRAEVAETIYRVLILRATGASEFSDELKI